MQQIIPFVEGRVREILRDDVYIKLYEYLEDIYNFQFDLNCKEGVI